MDRLKRALRARFLGARSTRHEAAAIATAIESRRRNRGEPDDRDLATTELVRSTAEVRTPKAAGYLAQLCKHFAHKIPASYEGNEGRISFPRGECRLRRRATC